MTAASSPQDYEGKLHSLICGDLLHTPPGFGRDSDLFAAGLDSMAIMQLLLLIEEEFGVAIPVESVSRENFKTVRAIATLVESRSGTAAGTDSGATPVPAAGQVPPVQAVVEQIVSTAAPEPAPAPVATAVSVDPIPATFVRRDLRDCDFFVVGFDQMLRSGGQVGHIAHSMLDLSHPPDVNALRDCIAGLAEKYPMLCARLSRRRPWELPTWTPAESPVSPELRLWSQEGSPGALRGLGAEGFSGLQDLLEDITNAPLSRAPERWVNSRFNLVEKRDGSCLFIFSWSHLVMDGVGAELFLTEMQRGFSGHGEPVPPFSDDTDARGWGERWKSATPMVQRFYKIMEQRLGCLSPLKMQPGRTHFRVYTLTPEQSAEAARRAAAVSGPLINMPFHLACAMRAHRRIFQHRGQATPALMSSVPVQVRRKGTRGPLFQNHLTMFFGMLGGDEMNTLDDAARALQQQHASYIKDGLGAAFRDLMWLMRPMPPGLHMQFIKWQMRGIFSSFYHSNTGVFAPEMNDFFGAPIQNAWHVPGISAPPGTGIFCNEKHGRLVLTLCWRDGAMTSEECDIFMAQVFEDLGADTDRV